MSCVVATRMSAVVPGLVDEMQTLSAEERERALAASSQQSRQIREILDQVVREQEEVRARKQQRARALAEQQKVQPIRSIDDLRSDFWPAEESTDDFLSWLRHTRQDTAHRSLPE